MLPKDNEILHPNDVGVVLMVSLLNMAQYLNLKKSLFGALWLILDDLDSNVLFIFVVEGLDNLSIRSFANRGNNFIPIGNMITLNVFVKFALYSKNYSSVSKSAISCFTILCPI